MHQEIKTVKKGADILIYVKNHIKFKIIKNLSVSDGDKECVTVEIENENSKNLILNFVIDRQVVSLKSLTAF